MKHNKYFCIRGCGVPVKKKGFYCEECWPLCDSRNYFFECENRVKEEGNMCNLCRQCSSCDRCDRRSLKPDGKCKICIYKCAASDCKKYVKTDKMYCFEHSVQCSGLNCTRSISMPERSICLKCQCKTKGCKKEKIFGYNYCVNCKSAWFFFWFLRFHQKFPLEIITIILKLSEMPTPIKINKNKKN